MRSGSVDTKALLSAVVFLVAIVAALGFRLPMLGERPMHTDEAIHGIKLGMLMEEGTWKYDPADYHGPAQPYLTLPLTWITGKHRAADLDEVFLRLVPVAFGIALIPFSFLLLDGLKPLPLSFAALFLAVSPMFVYFSRYYIMEIVLVFFCLTAIGCGWRYYVSRSRPWLIGLGVSLGMMHATKETCIIHYFAMAAAVAGCLLIDLFRSGTGSMFLDRVKRKPITRAVLLPVALSALGASLLFFTSFFTDWSGPLNSILTYQTYLGRAGGGGHEKPWFYYLELLWWKRLDPFLWSEAGIYVLASIGALTALLQKPERNESLNLRRFLSLYLLVIGVVYSLISYKTPWTIMGFHHAAILLAGSGAVSLITFPRSNGMRAFWVVAVLAMCGHLGLQSFRANFRYAANDARNPYVYSHTSTAFLKLVERLHDLAKLRERSGGPPLVVQVIHPEAAWPLPWYFRDQESIGYHEPPDDPADPAKMKKLESDLADADVIITDIPIGEHLSADLRQRYTEDGPHSLRPDSWLTVLIRNELWQAFIESRSTDAPAPGAGDE